MVAKLLAVLGTAGSAFAQFKGHKAAWFANSDTGFPSFGPASDSSTDQQACTGTHSNYTLTLKDETKNAFSGAAGRCSELTKEGSGTQVFYDINCVCKVPASGERTVPKDTDEWDAQYYDGIQPGLKQGCGNAWEHVEIRAWTGRDGSGAEAECTTDWNANRDATDAAQHWVMYLTKAQWQTYYDGGCVPDVQVKAWKGYHIEQSSGAKDDNQVEGWAPYKTIAMRQFEPWDENIMTCGAKSPTVAPTTSPSQSPTITTPAPTAAPTAPTAPPTTEGGEDISAAFSGGGAGMHSSASFWLSVLLLAVLPQRM